MPFSRQQLAEIKDILIATINETLLGNKELIQTIANAVVKQIKGEIEDHIKNVEKTVCELSKECLILRQKVSVLEQQERRNNLRIFGLKVDNSNNLTDTVIRMFNTKFNLNLHSTDLEYTFLTKRRNINNSPILVRFKNYTDKNLVMKNKKNLKNSGMFLADDLTPSNYDLLQKAKEKYGKNKAWTLDGKVFCDDGNGKRGIKRMEDLDGVE